MSDPSPRRWSDRALGGAVGAVAVGLAWITCSGGSRPSDLDIAEAPAISSPADVESRPPISRRSTEVAAAEVGAVGPPSRESAMALTGPVVETVRAQPDLGSRPGAGEPPSIGLPQMPGTRPVKADANRDGDAWLVVQALAVPAAVELVETFYRTALREAGFALVPDRDAAPTDAGEGAAQAGDHPESGNAAVILRGRAPKTHVQVSMHQRPGQLQTRVRVMWRAWD